MTYKVLLTDDAVIDLQALHSYIAEHDSPVNADYVLDQIESVVNSFAEQPNRGSYVNELEALGITEYREVYFKPYRVIYRLLDDAVYVYLIADGRRDMQQLLARRLLVG